MMMAFLVTTTLLSLHHVQAEPTSKPYIPFRTDPKDHPFVKHRIDWNDNRSNRRQSNIKEYNVVKEHNDKEKCPLQFSLGVSRRAHHKAQNSQAFSIVKPPIIHPIFPARGPGRQLLHTTLYEHMDLLSPELAAGSESSSSNNLIKEGLIQHQEFPMLFESSSFAYSSPIVHDVNGDGIPDAIVSDYDGGIYIVGLHQGKEGRRWFHKAQVPRIFVRRTWVEARVNETLKESSPEGHHEGQGEEGENQEWGDGSVARDPYHSYFEYSSGNYGQKDVLRGITANVLGQKRDDLDALKKRRSQKLAPNQEDEEGGEDSSEGDETPHRRLLEVEVMEDDDEMEVTFPRRRLQEVSEEEAARQRSEQRRREEEERRQRSEQRRREEEERRQRSEQRRREEQETREREERERREREEREGREREERERREREEQERREREDRERREREEQENREREDRERREREDRERREREEQEGREREERERREREDREKHEQEERERREREDRERHEREEQERRQREQEEEAARQRAEQERVGEENRQKNEQEGQPEQVQGDGNAENAGEQQDQQHDGEAQESGEQGEGQNEGEGERGEGEESESYSRSGRGDDAVDAGPRDDDYPSGREDDRYPDYGYGDDMYPAGGYDDYYGRYRSYRDDYYDEKHYVRINPHILSTPTLAEVPKLYGNEGEVEDMLFVPVSYYLDEDEYEGHLAYKRFENTDAGDETEVQRGMYVASAIMIYQLGNDPRWGRQEHLDLSTDHSSPQNVTLLGQVPVKEDNTRMGAFALSRPAIADIDGDDKLEVLIGTSMGIVYAFDATHMTMKNNWPIQMQHAVESPVVVEDIAANTKLEILVSDIGGNVACFDEDANKVWHRDLLSAVGGNGRKTVRGSSHMSLGDVDGDGTLDAVLALQIRFEDSNTEKTYVFAMNGANGEDLAKFPLAFDTPSSLRANPNEDWVHQQLPGLLLVDLHEDQSHIEDYIRRNGTKWTKRERSSSKPGGGTAPGLHVVLAVGETLFMIEAGSGCIQNFGVGEEVVAQVQVDDVHGTNNLDLVVSTVSGNIITMESSSPYHPLNVWNNGEFRGRFNNHAHGYSASQGIFVHPRSREYRDIFGVFVPVTFEIFDNRPNIQFEKQKMLYKVEIRDGTSTKRAIFRNTYNETGVYTERLYIPHGAGYYALTVQMRATNGLVYEDIFHIGYNVNYMDGFGLMLWLPLLLAAITIFLGSSRNIRWDDDDYENRDRNGGGLGILG